MVTNFAQKSGFPPPLCDLSQTRNELDRGVRNNILEKGQDLRQLTTPKIGTMIWENFPGPFPRPAATQATLHQHHRPVVRRDSRSPSAMIRGRHSPRRPDSRALGLAASWLAGSLGLPGLLAYRALGLAGSHSLQCQGRTTCCLSGSRAMPCNARSAVTALRRKLYSYSPAMTALRRQLYNNSPATRALP